MSTKHPKARRMDPFDWFIGDCLILARCREIPSGLIRRIQWREFYSENWQERIFLKMDTNFAS